MGSTLISLRETVRAMRLVQEACELGDDPIAWRRHFIEGLLKLLGVASAGVCCVMRQPLDAANIDVPLQFWTGADEAQVAGWNRYLSEADITGDPNTPPLMALGSSNFTRFRQEITSDREWYGSPHFNEVRRPLKMDDLLYTQIMSPARNYSSGIGFVRELDGKPFNRRHSAIVHLAHMEMARMCNRRPAAQLLALGPRLRQVLQLVCQGLSEKEIALDRQLSSVTVHNHISSLHRKLNVHSRAQLVATGLRLFRSRGPRFLPMDPIPELLRT